MNLHLSPQEQMIVKMLSDYQWHCPTAELFMKDDRARISALRRKGYIIEDDWCKGTCGVKHYSRPKLRRLVQSATKTVTRVIEKDGKYYPIKVEVPLFAL